MTLEVINAAAAVGTMLLLATTAVAGLIQLRHMRAGNQLAAALAIDRDFRSDDVQAALRYVQDELPGRIQTSDYRAELEAPGYIDQRRHPEMILCNWFNRTGALVRGGFLKESLFLESYARLVTYYWQLLGPVVAVLRRTRGPGQYASFELLAYRAQLWTAARQTPGSGRAPRAGAIADPWLEEDARGAPGPVGR